MKGQIFNLNKPVAHNGRNGFDLSSQHVFDMRPSVIRPVVTQFTVPNSSYKINCADLVRTGALQTAAFLRGKQELDFFFVPFSQLFSFSNNIIFGRDEDHSTALANIQYDSLPTVSLAALIYNAWLPYFVCRVWHESVDKTYNDEKVGEMSIQGLLTWLTNVQTDSQYFETYLRQFMSQMFYDAHDKSAAVSTCNFVGSDVCHLLSTLGYGDYLSHFDFIYSRLVVALGYQPGEVMNPEDVAGVLSLNVVDVMSLISEYITECSFSSSTGVISAVPGTSLEMVSVMPLLAYHKVFYDYYRDSVNDDDILYLFSYNGDSMPLQEYYVAWNTVPFVDLNSAHPDNEMLCMTLLTCHRRSFRKDISTGIYSSPQFGLYGSQLDIEENDYFHDSSELGATDSDSAYSIQFALAMQRYRQTLLRAGNRAKDLLMAEFGVKSHYINDTYCKYLGSFAGQLDLNKVSATAESGDYSVGDLAGNVFSSLNGDTIEFTCNDHGIIIGCMSFIADPLHNAMGTSAFLYKTKQFDFFHEAFENLGMQPVSSKRFLPMYYDGFTDHRVETLGFGVRYNEYKQNIDQVHDTFMVAPPVDPDNEKYVKDGINSNYVCVRNPLQTVSELKQRVYMLPDIMDTIFKEYDTGLPEDYHFQVTLEVGITAVLPMSVTGLI